MKNNNKNYYELTKNVKPHLNLTKFLSFNLPPKKAIDIGCGAGRDTVALLKNNWEVLSIDKENTESIIKEQLTSNELNKFNFSSTVFGKMALPKTNLIVANYSLPFTKKEYFYSVWDNINNSISDDGYFVGNFFGKNDSWSQIRNDMVFLSENEVKNLFTDFDIIRFNEIETDDILCSGEEKHWHIYDIIAKKKTVKRPTMLEIN